jgi:hypothetical protein
LDQHPYTANYGGNESQHSSWQLLRNIQQEPDQIVKPKWVQQKKLKDNAAEVWHHP